MSFPVAFVAGFVSFLSPCVLPLLPAYLSLITGLTTADLASGDRPAARIMVPSALFVAGFSLVFVGLGASASVLGQLLSQYRDVVEKVAGLVVIAFGILMLGVVRIPWLYGEARLDVSRLRASGRRGAALAMGVAFAAGWTPCVGPILGSILALAGSSGSVARGALLLLVYSAGLAVPFLVVAGLFGRVRPLLSALGRHALVVNRVAGAVLILVGVALVSGRFELLSSYLSKVLPFANL